MPDGLRQFAEYQPFTPVADTVRGLLTGAAVGDHAIVAVAWSIGIAVVVLPLGHPPLQPASGRRPGLSEGRSVDTRSRSGSPGPVVPDPPHRDP